MPLKKKNSQVTIFLILGIILVIAVVSVIMLSRFASKKTTDQEVTDIQEAAIDVQPIRNFVSECVNIQTKQALEFLGGQGGYLFNSQGGTLLEYPDYEEGNFFLNFEDKKVVFNILRTRFAAGIYGAKPPKYPWKTFPYEDETRTQEVYQAKGAFGMSNLPPLNKSYGVHSIQEQIERYIANNIDQCLVDETFEEQGFLVQKHDKKVEALINQQDITIRLSYPMEVSNIVSGETTKLEAFTTKVPVRFGQLHAFIKATIEQDTSNIQFDMSKAARSAGFSVSVIRDIFEQNDIVTITDEQTRINGRPYSYIFARQNRPPALFYVPEQVSVPRIDPATSSPIFLTEDIIIPNYPSGLQALDPDEDLIDSSDFSIQPSGSPQFLLPAHEFTIMVSDGRLSDFQTVTVVEDAS